MDFSVYETSVSSIIDEMNLEQGAFGKMPTHQNAIDLFKGEWSSVFPSGLDVVTDGFAATYEDERLLWAQRKLGGYQDKSILELGPLEGGHSYLLQKLGAASVLSIEASPKAYLKCLIAKEVLKMYRCDFRLGDFMAYVSSSPRRFDVCIACGVLYHLLEPVALIRGLSACCDKAFIWTHYYKPEMLIGGSRFASMFGEVEKSKIDGVYIEGIRHYYRDSIASPRYCGGQPAGSVWLSEDSLFCALSHYGFRVIDSMKEDHVNGPAIWIAVERK